MRNSVTGLVLYLICSFCATFAKSQEKPIGYWESILPYNTGLGVATDGTTLFTVGTQAFFTFNSRTGEANPYAKETGMSDIGMQCVGYDPGTSTAILTYYNGNIDLFKDNTFYNIPDLKLKSVAGTKAIYQIYTDNGLAFLCSSLGVLVIDLSNHSITESYQFYHQDSLGNRTIPVRSFAGSGQYYYAATDAGLYRADKSNNDLVNYQVWTRIDSTHGINRLVSLNNKLFLANAAILYTMQADTFFTVYAPSGGIQHIDSGINHLLIGAGGGRHNGNLVVIDLNYNITDSFDCVGSTTQAVQLADSSIWLASTYSGLLKRTGPNEVGAYIPNGPSDPYVFDMYAGNSSLYIAHGGFGSTFYFQNNTDDISCRINGKWTHYKKYAYSPFDTLQDFCSVLKDELDGTLYFGSYDNGLFILKPDGSYQLVGQNSIFDPSTANGAASHQIAGMALDKSDNLWVTTMFSESVLYLKTADSIWYKIPLPGVRQGGQVVIDDYNQVWFASYSGGGVVVYNTNNTIKNFQDDNWYHLGSGAGNGNLPGSNVNCIAKDRNNAIWVGTDDGIGIVSNCSAPFSGTAPCDAQIPVVQYDKYAGYLFKGSNVRTIAVDGANRKWVGTDEGLWLLSPDASQIVYKFTTGNSPLPSNVVSKVVIDNVTGDVYIATDQGLISFRSTATQGGDANQNVLVFPNPVPSGYSGTIAIKGLVTDGDVRITDISGQLVYKTKALGGQAIWNGRDYTGRKPQSGVYLVFVTSADGAQTYSGKIVFLQ